MRLKSYGASRCLAEIGALVFLTFLTRSTDAYLTRVLASIQEWHQILHCRLKTDGSHDLFTSNPCITSIALLHRGQGTGNASNNVHLFQKRGCH